MRSKYLVLLAALFINVNADEVWLKDLFSPKGWNLGYGVVLKLNESFKGKDLPIMERLSLDVNFGKLVGVSVGKADSEGIDLDFYVKKNVDYSEGRGKKGGDDKYIIPMVIGYKAALMISVAFAVMKMLTMKAIILAKAALLISIVVLLMKLKHQHHAPELIEVEQHGFYGPHYEKEQGSGHGYGGSYGGGYGGGFGGHQSFGREAQPSNLYHDIVYPSSAVAAVGAESNNAYPAATVDDVATPVIVGRKGQDIERRRDNMYYRKTRSIADAGSLFSFKKYASIEI